MPEQWVNLPKEDIFVADGITSKERLGAVNFKVTFENASLAEVKFRVVPDDAAVYTSDETSRNARFDVEHGKGVETNLGGSDVEVAQEISLPAAGGGKFKIEAAFDGKTVESDVLEARRRLFFQSLPMDGINVPDLAPVVDAFWDTGKKFYVKLVEKGGGKTIPAATTVSAFGYVGPEARKQYQLKDYDPHAFVVVWVEYIVREGTTTRPVEFPFNLPKRTVKDLAGESLKGAAKVGGWLWHGFDAIEDASQSWLTSCSFEFIPDSGSPTSLALPMANVTLKGAKAFTHGGYNAVDVLLPLDELASLQSDTAEVPGKLKFVLTFRTVAFSGGQAGETMNLITIASKAMWADRSDTLRLNDLIHEIGHKLGMVPDGLGAVPDKPAGYYVAQGHNGNHCGSGAAYGSATWTGDPTCVMFGSDHDGKRPSVFCAACEPVVRKLDLSGRLPGLTKSVAK
jgi:type VI secretion system secreted protein VgrG